MTREAANRVTMVDPNIRPGFIKDEAAYRARVDRMMALADIVKLSDEDLEWLIPEGDIDSRAAQVLAMGPKLLCITRGKDGATGYTNRGRVDVGSERVTVVDTVGAGDTFNAGVLASLDQAGVLDKDALANLHDDVIADALRLGAKAAAITVSRAGANPPWTHEL
jgi:fructokinase